uniref:Prenyltransferase PT1 n=1 Tax=Clematis terniflora TaxID=231663 RepID=A0A7S5AK54_CLETE|nr:prenyltransferase PT1 [Clematis terniflora]
MISALASPAITSAACPKVWQTRPLDGFSLRSHESRNLTSSKNRRCSRTVSSSLPHKFENIDSQISSRENPSPKYSVSPPFDSVDGIIQEKEFSIYSWTNIAKKLGACYQFIRPFQIRSAILEIIVISLFPVQAISDLSPTFFVRLLKTIIPVVFVYVYANGLNEITDLEIDKINKPFLPLASGDLSLTEATAIISISSVIIFLITATLNSVPMSIAIMSIFLAFSAYSIDLPLLRWKKNAVLAAATLTTIQGIVTPLCFFAHAQTYILGKPLVFTKTVFFTMAVMTSFGVVISIFKDISDLEGDKAHGVRSTSAIYGVEKVFWSSIYILLATYGGAAIFGATSPNLLTKIIAVLGHGIPAIILWTRTKSTNISDPTTTFPFYLFIWKLRIAEYLLIPFVC